MNAAAPKSFPADAAAGPEAVRGDGAAGGGGAVRGGKAADADVVPAHRAAPSSQASGHETPFPPDEMRVLAKAIRRIVRANDLQSRALARASGLTTPQLVVLTGVAELGEVTTNALSAYADLSAPTVVTVLENLEQRGIIDRYRSTEDRRVVYTRLTEKGLSMVANTPGLFGPRFAARFLELAPEKRAGILAAVGELAGLMAREG